MQLSRHFYAIGGLAVLLTALSVGSSKPTVAKAPPTSVLVTNSSLPVTVSASSAALKIGNSKSDPIPVRDVDVASRVHVQGYANAAFSDGQGNADVVMYSVPVGKRLVIEGMTMRASIPTGQAVWGMAISGPYYVEVKPQGTNILGQETFVGTLQAPLQFAGPTIVEVFVQRNVTSGEGSAFVTYTGYLVNEPVPAP